MLSAEPYGSRKDTDADRRISALHAPHGRNRSVHPSCPGAQTFAPPLAGYSEILAESAKRPKRVSWNGLGGCGRAAHDCMDSQIGWYVHIYVYDLLLSTPELRLGLSLDCAAGSADPLAAKLAAACAVGH